MNVAIIGMGGMGRRHIEAAMEAGYAVTAVCDLFEDSARDAVKGLDNQPTIFTDWAALLKQVSLFDVLVIATNGPSHHEIALAAANAKVPYLLCEKPLSTSGAKAREIADVCKRNGTRLGVNMARRFMETPRAIKQAIQNNAIGTVQHFNFQIGAGGLGCIGTHYFDMPAWLLDTSPQWVSGTIDANPAPNVRGEQFFDPGGRAIVGYGDGVTALFECSGDAARLSRGEIIGSHGHITFDDFAREGMIAQIFARPKAERETPCNRYVAPEPVEPGIAPGPFEIVRPTRRCLQALVEGSENTVSGAIDAVDVVMAIHLSDQLGGWDKIPLPLVGDQLNLDIPIT